MNTLKISELSRASGVSAETIRYYERNGLLPAAERGSNGYRRFGTEALETLAFIKTCRSLGFSIEETRQLAALLQRPADNCRRADELAAAHLRQVEEKIRQLQKIRRILHNIGACANEQAGDCTVLNTLKAAK